MDKVPSSSNGTSGNGSQEDPVPTLNAWLAVVETFMVVVAGLLLFWLLLQGVHDVMQAASRRTEHQANVTCLVLYRVVGPKDVAMIAQELGVDSSSIERQIHTQVIAIRDGDTYHLRVPCNPSITTTTLPALDPEPAT